MSKNSREQRTPTCCFQLLCVLLRKPFLISLDVPIRIANEDFFNNTLNYSNEEFLINMNLKMPCHEEQHYPHLMTDA